LLPDASRRQQQAADFIHYLFGAKRLTTSGFTCQRPFMTPSGSFSGLQVIRSLLFAQGT
jgi:hypothetical protein